MRSASRLLGRENREHDRWLTPVEFLAGVAQLHHLSAAHNRADRKWPSPPGPSTALAPALAIVLKPHSVWGPLLTRSTKRRASAPLPRPTIGKTGRINVRLIAANRRFPDCGVSGYRGEEQRLPVSWFVAMSSWRDAASASAQDDLDGLLNTVLPLAEDLLGKHREFFPFGGCVSTEGEASLTAADPGLGERPSSDEVLATLYAGARVHATSTRAAAFVADVRANGSDAVRVELEHQEGTSLVVLLPYARRRFKRALTFGQMSVSQREPKVWTAQ